MFLRISLMNLVHAPSWAFRPLPQCRVPFWVKLLHSRRTCSGSATVDSGQLYGVLFFLWRTSCIMIYSRPCTYAYEFSSIFLHSILRYTNASSEREAGGLGGNSEDDDGELCVSSSHSHFRFQVRAVVARLEVCMLTRCFFEL